MLKALRDCLAARSDDAVVLNCVRRTLLVFCLAKRVLPFLRFKLISVDLVLGPALTLRERARTRVIGWLLEAADLFIFPFRDISGLRRLYGIFPDRVSYVPFEVNGYPDVLAVPTRDDGHILACGRSYRDYGTFGRAMAGLPYVAHILVRPAELSRHGSEPDTASLPPAVAVFEDDGSVRSWLDRIARARLIVLPILPNVVSAAGISVCLLSMALRKCVIMSEGPATSGVLDEGQARPAT